MIKTTSHESATGKNFDRLSYWNALKAGAHDTAPTVFDFR